jgi:hypothetical protein
MAVYIARAIATPTGDERAGAGRNRGGFTDVHSTIEMTPARSPAGLRYINTVLPGVVKLRRQHLPPGPMR